MLTIAAHFAAVNAAIDFETFHAPGFTDADRGFFRERDVLDTEAASWASFLDDEATEADEYDAWLDGHADELADEAAMTDAFDLACYHGHSAA